VLRTSVRGSYPAGTRYRRAVIENVVIHMHSEQPLMCDIRELPSARDACLVCTNLRFVDGRKPAFIDRSESWFLIPLSIVRLIEIRQGAIQAAEAADVPALGAGQVLGDDDGESDGTDAADKIDPEEELLRRIRAV
jgi:hypothetical protein